MSDSSINPAYISIADAAIYTGESEWTVRDHIRQGHYRAKKSGRRVLVETASIDERLASLPDATYAPLHRRTLSGASA
jgi:excisionase family DNA binding protein